MNKHYDAGPHMDNAMARVLALREQGIRQQQAERFADVLQRFGFTTQDLDQLAEAAFHAWGRASGQTREVIFRWKHTDYRSTLSTFSVKIFTMDHIYIFAAYTPDHWPTAPKKARTRAVAQIPRALRFAVLKRDDYRCRLCGIAAKDGLHVRLEVDHITAVDAGGTNDISNLWVLCLECNRGKGTEDL